jgi:hypothetical protein
MIAAKYLPPVQPPYEGCHLRKDEVRQSSSSCNPTLLVGEEAPNNRESQESRTDNKGTVKSTINKYNSDREKGRNEKRNSTGPMFLLWFESMLTAVLLFMARKPRSFNDECSWHDKGARDTNGRDNSG